MSLMKIGRVEKETLSSRIVFNNLSHIAHKDLVKYWRLDIDASVTDPESFRRRPS
jgi:hypothetical protein